MFHTGVEWAGEADLVPTHVVSFSGCNLWCAFCLTGEQSQNARAGQPLDIHAIIADVAARSSQLRSLTILGGEPSVHLPGALELIAALPAPLPVVWKTNGYSSVHALELLDGCVDVTLADLKFGNDCCARRLAGVDDYLATLDFNLAAAAASSRLIVRHLLMPGHLDCCTMPVLERLAKRMPNVAVSLMSGFLPLFRTARHVELTGTVGDEDRSQAVTRADALGLDLVPWRIAPETAFATRGGDDELWVDRTGRILVDSASPELLRCLHRLDDELRLDGPSAGATS